MKKKINMPCLVVAPLLLLFRGESSLNLNSITKNKSKIPIPSFVKLVMVTILFFSATNNLCAQNEADAPCITGGTLLFKEDFGGDNLADPISISKEIENGYSDFAPGNYIYAKYMYYSNNAIWLSWDHTSLTDVDRGYMLHVNPPQGTSGKTLYGVDINNLCGGVKVVLSVWVMSVNKPGWISPKMELQIRGVSNNILATTGLKDLGAAASQTACKWQQICLEFTVPVGTTTIKFLTINREDSTNGNDWNIDDLEVRLVTNTVNATVKSSATTDVLISNSTRFIPFTGSFVNDARFGTSLASYWLYSPTGDITNLTDWTIVDSKPAAAIANGATWTHNFTLINPKTGYYRLVIGNPTNVLTSKCRAASEVFHVHK